jgi:hypothetical protein
MVSEMVFNVAGFGQWRKFFVFFGSHLDAFAAKRKKS